MRFEIGEHDAKERSREEEQEDPRSSWYAPVEHDEEQEDRNTTSKNILEHRRTSLRERRRTLLMPQKRTDFYITKLNFFIEGRGGESKTHPAAARLAAWAR